MRWFRWSRILKVAGLSVIVVTIATSGYIRIRQYQFRHDMENLLTDMRDLQSGKPGSESVQRVIQRWNFEKILGEKCLEEDCVYRFERAGPTSSSLEYFDDREDRWRQPASTALTWLGGRPALVRAFIAINQNTVRPC